MPLKHSVSDEARSQNIAELIKAGHTPKQAAAIAYRVQREAKADARARKRKGKL